MRTIESLYDADTPASDAGMAIVAYLDQLRRTIQSIPASAYQARPAPRVSGSIGEHVRHCLDHVAALTTAAAAHSLSYDHRLRGTDVERDPQAALDEIDRLTDDVLQLLGCPLSRPLAVHVLLDRDSMELPTRSSVGREIAYVVQHTVHHGAVIALLLDRLGLAGADGLGLAPSTPRRH